MNYEGTVYRPPSERNSLIFQVTIGCAHNTCTFCSMYKDKSFRVRPKEDVLAEIREAGRHYGQVRRIFFADGDALVLPTDTLLAYAQEAKASFPKLQRIGIYATVQDILRKSPEDLAALKEAAISIFYIGLESGSPDVLKAIQKDIKPEDFALACQKARAAGIRTSVTVVAGLGQAQNRQRDAQLTAQAISQAQPNFLSYLTLYLEPGAPLYDDLQAGTFSLPTPEESLEEIGYFLQEVDAPGCIFRSNHPSNYIALAGTLNKDRDRLLNDIAQALENENFRPEFWRAL